MNSLSLGHIDALPYLLFDVGISRKYLLAIIVLMGNISFNSTSL